MCTCDKPSHGSLIPASYEVGDLYLRTKNFFHKPEDHLSDSQREGKNYITSCIDSESQKAHFQHLDLSSVNTHIYKLASAIDNFFFQGALLNPEHCQILNLFVFEDSTTATIPWSGHRGHNISWGRNVRGKTRRLRTKPGATYTAEIGLVRTFRGKKRSLESMLATLVHEMVHAWYSVYSKNYHDPEIAQHDFHGKYWQKLFSAIVMIMRKWHPRLSEFAYCDRAWKMHEVF
ncbi:hypothetical protein BX600DRAFT_38554 [Xylariales sp. PMI_506]|nr:hypothetical protein BX600DRAFT_38554 [Xylariales sp. PMI_506]